MSHANSSGPVLVSSREEVLDSLLTFNHNAQANLERVRSILKDGNPKHPKYWVYHRQTRLFAPSKFAGYAGMTFEKYTYYKEYKDIYKNGTHGKDTWKAIAKSLALEYQPMPKLAEDLVTGSSVVNAPSYAASETPGNPVCRTNPLSRSGRCLTVINSSTT